MTPDPPLSEASRRLRRKPGRKAASRLQAVAPQARSASGAPEPPARTGPAAPVVAPLWPRGPRLLPLRQGAAYLGISPYTLRDWLAAGVLPSVQIDLPVGLEGRQGNRFRKVLVDIQDLDEFIARAKHPQLLPLPVERSRKPNP